MEIIRSIKHDAIREMIALLSSSGRKESGHIPVYGMQAVCWAVKAGLHLETVFISEKADREHSDYFLKEKFPVLRITELLSRKIVNSSHDTDVCALAVKKEASLTKALSDRENIVILDCILDHGNIGTIIRTMRAFNFNTLVLTNYETDIYYKNIVNSSRGEAFNVNFHNIPAHRLLETLDAHGYKLIATRPENALNVNSLEPFDFPYAVVFGNETDGISENLIRHQYLSVGCPMENEVESLNVGVAAGIILNKLNHLGCGG